MNTKSYPVTFIILLSISTISCSLDTDSANNTIIASVSGHNLTLSEAIENIPDFVLNQDSTNAIHSYANQWIQTEVAVQHARRLGIQNTSEYQNRMVRYQNQLLETLLKEQILESNRDQIEVLRDEALNYYQTHREQLTFDEKFIQYRHLTTQTRTEAENANRDLMNGIEWETIVNQYSINPELQLRQSTQFWPISLAASDIPPLNQNLRTLGLSERSTIHYFGNYYHLVQLMDERTEEEYPELDWLIPQITEWLKLEKSRRITNAYLRNLYLQADSNNEIELRTVSDIERILTQ
ncbi:MAG: hypothetical protein WD513_04565 [Balneolaceae bacterium]